MIKELKYYYIVQEGQKYHVVLIFAGGYLYHSIELNQNGMDYENLQIFLLKAFKLNLPSLKSFHLERFIVSKSVKRVYTPLNFENILQADDSGKDFYADFYELQKQYKDLYFRKTLSHNVLNHLTANFRQKYHMSIDETERMLNDEMPTRELYNLIISKKCYKCFTAMELL